ncbi:MAG TPA: MBL fold metallo-hydrolase [Terracidiphilus sp.]|nr:MBL fold metallo-hydrolase [Terracidiphilus sp.]
MTQRRTFLQSAAGALGVAVLLPGSAQARTLTKQDESAKHLPDWQPGTLEIHHIDTGRGNATLVLGPDGTSILIDAGEAHSPVKFMSQALPDASRTAGEWIARYVGRQLKRTGETQLDTLLLTHFHGDHVGEVSSLSPRSKRGGYRLTGAAFVADALPIGTVIDRGWPDYSYPAAQTDTSALNYIALARALSARGATVQRAQAGSSNQIRLRNPNAYPKFKTRILSVNGTVWTGSGDASKALFPQQTRVSRESLPSENMCCVSLRLEYGAFRYYAGGDLCSDTDYGKYAWHDIETPVSSLAGAVSVAVANHHGYFDACGPEIVRNLRPQAWIVPTWHVSHPDLGVLANLCSRELYSGERRIFATGMAPAARLVTDRFSSQLASTEGHVVVRVPEGGRIFTIHVLDSRNECGMIKASFGPFDA